MARGNEFLRGKPGHQNRNILFDLTNFIIPVIFVLIGIFLSTQHFAKLCGFDVTYTDYPFYQLKARHFGLPKGYPFYNPFLILLNIAANPFDENINSLILPTFYPLIICTVCAVIAFFVTSAIRGYGMNKAENLYGSARWAVLKDLKQAKLLETDGVVLAETYDARLSWSVNAKTGSPYLIYKHGSRIIGHSGGTNTLLIASTRTGKGVSSIIPTCLFFGMKNNNGSMIIFDPKGELYNITAGYRRHMGNIVLKFSPVSEETVCFNPLEEIVLNKEAFSQVGLILANIFEEPKGGNDGTNQFFDNAAKDILTALILHILSCNQEQYKDKKNLAGVLSVLSQASSQKEDGGGDEDGGGAGEELLNEMINSPHFDDKGEPSESIHRIISDAASRCLGQHAKVRSDTFSTIFTKMNLFSDPYIIHATSHSDFKLSDFYDSKKPISLYLTVPFSHIDRIAPVFKLIINFILRKFSSGELRIGREEKKLKNKILFMLDEFPVLGAQPFIQKTAGILAGYGITFYFVVQSLDQILDLYGQHQTIVDNCRTIMIFAPQKAEQAKPFCEMIGKESVMHDSISASGSRYSVSLNNLNASSQEIARDLMNPDELCHLPYTDAIVLQNGIPAYIAKKICYFGDPRFKDKAFSERRVTERYKLFGFLPVPFTKVEKTVRTGYPAPYNIEELQKICSELPSNIRKKEQESEHSYAVQPVKSADEPPAADGHGKALGPSGLAEAALRGDSASFDPVAYLETFAAKSWDSPAAMRPAARDLPPPPSISEFKNDIFSSALSNTNLSGEENEKE